MVSGQVLADKAGHFEHVQTRHGEDRLQRTVGLDDAALIELVRLDVTQIFFVTSVRGSDFAPQIAANAGLRDFLAKMPFPAFFIARAFFFAEALLAILPAVFFAALIFFNSALVIVVFVVFTAAVLVPMYSALKERRCPC